MPRASRRASVAQAGPAMHAEILESRDVEGETAWCECALGDFQELLSGPLAPCPPKPLRAEGAFFSQDRELREQHHDFCANDAHLTKFARHALFYVRPLLIPSASGLSLDGRLDFFNQSMKVSS